MLRFCLYLYTHLLDDIKYQILNIKYKHLKGQLGPLLGKPQNVSALPWILAQGSHLGLACIRPALAWCHQMLIIIFDQSVYTVIHEWYLKHSWKWTFFLTSEEQHYSSDSKSSHACPNCGQGIGDYLMCWVIVSTSNECTEISNHCH